MIFHIFIIKTSTSTWKMFLFMLVKYPAWDYNIICLWLLFCLFPFTRGLSNGCSWWYFTSWLNKKRLIFSALTVFGLYIWYRNKLAISHRTDLQSGPLQLQNKQSKSKLEESDIDMCLCSEKEGFGVFFYICLRKDIIFFTMAVIFRFFIWFILLKGSDHEVFEWFILCSHCHLYDMSISTEGIVHREKTFLRVQVSDITVKQEKIKTRLVFPRGHSDTTFQTYSIFQNFF